MPRVSAGHKLGEGEMLVLDIDGRLVLRPLAEVYVPLMTPARTWGARSGRDGDDLLVES